MLHSFDFSERNRNLSMLFVKRFMVGKKLLFVSLIYTVCNFLGNCLDLMLWMQAPDIRHANQTLVIRPTNTFALLQHIR